MSQDTYTSQRLHPVTGKQTPCRVFLNYFGHGSDGYRFKGEHMMYSQDELVAMMPDNEDEEDEEREVD